MNYIGRKFLEKRIFNLEIMKDKIIKNNKSEQDNECFERAKKLIYKIGLNLVK